MELNRETRLTVDVIHTAKANQPDSDVWEVVISDSDGQEIDRAHMSNADNAWLQAFRFAKIEDDLELRPLCADCDSPVKVTLEPYGTGQSAKWDCPNCGVSYDTNLD